MPASSRPQWLASAFKGSPSTTPLLQAPYPWAKSLLCGHMHPERFLAPGVASRPPSPPACLLWPKLPSRELRSEAGQQGSPLLLLSPDQRCLQDVRLEQSPAWASLLAKPADAWLLPGSGSGFWRPTAVLGPFPDPPRKSNQGHPSILLL